MDKERLNGWSIEYRGPNRAVQQMVKLTGMCPTRKNWSKLKIQNIWIKRVTYFGRTTAGQCMGYCRKQEWC